jgi:replication factor A1
MSGFLPIKEISAYGRKGWSIKARVSSRQTMRTFDKNGRAGKLFNIDLLDQDGTEIRATLWNGCAEKYDEMLKTGKVYILTNGQAKLANKRYNNTGHNYELSFDENATITAVEGDDASISQVKLGNIVQLRKLATMDVPLTVNTCFVVTEVGEKRDIKTKPKNGSPGKDMFLRRVVVADASECDLEVTFWNEAADLCDTKVQKGTVVCIKGMKVTDYSGRNGSVFDASSVHTGLDLPECKEVKEWYEKSQGITLRSLTTGERKATDGENKSGTLAELEVEISKLAQDQQIYWDTTAYFSFLRLQREGRSIPLWYMACTKCGKKVTGDECIACQAPMRNPKMKYLLTSTLIEDSTATRWVTAFDNVGSELLGVSADDLAEKKTREGQDEQATMAMLDKLLRPKYTSQEYKLRLRAKMEEYQGQLRPRVQVLTADPVEKKLEEEVARLAKVLEVDLEGASDDAKAEVKAFFAGTDFGSVQGADLLAAAPSAAPTLERLQAVACA